MSRPQRGDASGTHRLGRCDLLVLASDPQPEIGLVYPMITRAVFERAGEDTLVTVTQSPHTVETQDGATAGWTESLDKLERLLGR